MSESMASADRIDPARSRRTRVRIHVAGTATRGYEAETTVEFGWDADDELFDDDAAAERLAEWLAEADAVARDEIERRLAADGGKDG